MSRLTLIVAATRVNGIGYENQLPWRLPKEMKYFARITSTAPENTQNAVIMGRNTWESIPTKFKPLVNRFNVVLTRKTDYDLSRAHSGSAQVASSLEGGLKMLKEMEQSSPDRVFIIGGGAIYTEALSLSTNNEHYVDRVLLTRILTPDYSCDIFLEDFLQGGDWERAKHSQLEEWAGFEVPEGEQEEKGVRYEYQMWSRVAYP